MANDVTRRSVRGRLEFVTATQFQATVRDISAALRYFRRNRGFFAVSVVNLALGIGATTAVFSVAEALLLRPPPYPESDRLVTLRSVDTVSDDRITRVARDSSPTGRIGRSRSRRSLGTGRKPSI